MGLHLGPRVPMGTSFRFWVPKRSPFFSRSPLSPFQTEERAKSQSSHYLLNVDHLNTCDDKTSFNESHASLSVKLSFVLQIFIYLHVYIQVFLISVVNFQKKSLFGSPFVLAKVPIRSPSHSKLGPHFEQNWVPMALGSSV